MLNQSNSLLLEKVVSEWRTDTLQTKFVRETLLSSQQVQKGHFGFLNSSEKNLDAAASQPSPRLFSLCLKGYRGVSEPVRNFVPWD